jgi:hypothetical protein
MALALNDRIAGAVVERGVPGIMRLVRPVMVVMSTALLSPHQILNHALLLGSIPQPGEPHEEDERCLLTRARAEAATDSLARIELIYERVPPTTFAEDTTTVPMRMECLPGTRRPVQMTAILPGWPAENPLRRTASFTYRCPMRKLVLGKALFGMPLEDLVPENAKSAVGCVNDRFWHGQERGFWLCDGLRTRAVDSSDDFSIALCYYVELSFFSMLIQDWSQWRFLRFPNGQYMQVSNGDIDAASAKKYNTSVTHPYPNFMPNVTTTIYGTSPAFHSPTGQGFAVIYPYPTANFDAILGVQ